MIEASDELYLDATRDRLNDRLIAIRETVEELLSAADYEISEVDSAEGVKAIDSRLARVEAILRRLGQ